MFFIPTILKEGDRITLTALTSSDPQGVSMSLITERNGQPDYSNIACQLDIQFASNGSSEEKILMKTLLDGYPDFRTASELPSELITGSNVTLSMSMENSSEGYIQFYIGDSFLDKIRRKHNFDNIKYLMLDGDVEKVVRLDFEFA